MKLEKLLGREVHAFYCSKCDMFETMNLGENPVNCSICDEPREMCNIEIKKFR